MTEHQKREVRDLLTYAEDGMRMAAHVVASAEHEEAAREETAAARRRLLTMCGELRAMVTAFGGR